ncbi:hypothetical protein Ate01nite_64990 [Actinoplanes teichomyceticus]|nr:hypothetical protein Ate01nite_64990 [Actinoplanes teichomyceticus]
MGRLAVTGVTLVALAGLSACGDKGTPATTTGGTGSTAAAATTAPANPAEELVAAARKLTGSSGKIHLTSVGGITADGSFDAENRLIALTLDMSSLGSTAEMRQIGNDLYVKYGGDAAKSFADGKWMHIDASKMPSTSALSLEKNDPRNSAKMLEAAIGVTKTGDGTFTGSVDMSKSPSATPEMVKLLKGKTVPFTAEVDGQGYLSKMALDIDSVISGGGQTVASYSDMGTKVSVSAPPASQTVEMPKSAITMMGG